MLALSFALVCTVPECSMAGFLSGPSPSREGVHNAPPLFAAQTSVSKVIL